MIAISEINHSGLFSDTKRHLSPSLTVCFIFFESLNIFCFVSAHVKFFLSFGFNHSKKILSGFKKFIERLSITQKKQM